MGWVRVVVTRIEHDGTISGSWYLRRRCTGNRRASSPLRLYGRWTAPGILEALIPGRMQSHASTAEVPR